MNNLSLSGSNSASYSNSSFSNSSSLQSIHNALGEEQSEREPLEMCCLNRKDMVLSSEYFYSTVKAINKTPEVNSSLRPENFKELKNKYRNEQYKKIRTQKKDAIIKLKEKIKESKGDHQHIKNLLIASARKGIPFSELPFSKFKDHYPQLFSILETAYNKSMQQASSSIFLKDVKNLCSLVTLDNFSQEDRKTIKEREKDHLNFLDKTKASFTLKDWDDQRIKFTYEIARIWEGNNEEGKPNSKQLFELCVKGFEPSRVKMQAILFSKIDKRITMKMSFSIICRFIFERIQALIEKEKNTNNEIFDQALKASSNLLKAYAEDTDTDKDIANIRLLLKEQKKHSFARFGYLAENYADFIRHAKLIEEAVAKIDSSPDSKTIIRQALSILLQHSHYVDLTQKIEDVEKKIKRSESCSDQELLLKEKLSKLQQQQKDLTVNHNHHEKHLMGYEADNYFSGPEEKATAIHTVNTIMQLFETPDEIKNFQHAHTFPFPAMFNWDEERMKQILKHLNINLSEDFEAPKRYISSNFFKKIRNGQSSKILDEAFINELNKIKQEVGSDKAKFIYCALDVLKHYHLRVFSETELFPDVINTYSDHFSEWSIALGKNLEPNSYKKNLALELSKLLEQDTVTKAMVAQCLSEYYKQTLNKIRKQEEYIKFNDDCTIIELFKKITAFQVEQSVFLAQVTTDIEVKPKN